FSVRAFQREATSALERITTRSHHALLVGGTGLYLRAVTDGLQFPGRFPDVAARLADELESAGPPGSESRRQGVAGLHRRLGLLDARAAGRMEPTNERRVLRALEVSIGAGRPFSSFGPGLERYPATAVAFVGIRPDIGALDRCIRERLERQMDSGFLEEVRSLAARPRGLSATARQALGYRELLTHVEEDVPLREALAEAQRRTRAFARRQWAWFRRDPRIEWVDSVDVAVVRVVDHLTADGRPRVGDCRGR
ncbi:MAG TPA: tRNA dimethylallyltransferase, partial [Acidimicrobiales bacterium]|nr:tRNA dimethylallyltransferase [Acidimicrobiales bacterium]